MSHLLYLIFQCDFDVIENLKSLREVNTAFDFFSSSLIAADRGVCLLQHLRDRDTRTPWEVETGLNLFNDKRD